MSTFDRIVIVDWSANAAPKRGADSIWICDLATAEGERPRLWNIPTRRAARFHLEALFRDALDKGEKVLAGFDFPFGFPGGFARGLGLAGTPWRATWRLLAKLIEDNEQNRNNRFGVAARLNRRLSGGAFPFWGCPESAAGRFLWPRKPARAYDDALAEHRLTDRLFRGPKPVWKIFTTGSVGGQTLTGIPVVHALRHTPALKGHARVWPFETGEAGDEMGRNPVLVLAEVYPSMIAAKGRAGEIKDRAQVRTLARHFAMLDRQGALVPLLREPAALPPASRRAVLNEEGWILGASSFTVATRSSRSSSRQEESIIAKRRVMPNKKQLRIKLTRAYDAPTKSDGCRVLVDRVWPRGVSKDALRLDEWLKELAPSAKLRTWFNHDPAKWETFKDRYFRELAKQPEAVKGLLAKCRRGTVTLVFGARETRYNNAVALKAYLERRL